MRAAFIKHGDFSHINASVLSVLKANFPEYHFDEYDVNLELTQHRSLQSILQCLRYYATDFITLRKKFKPTHLRTPYMFNYIRRSLLEKLNHRNYVFTFQTQSLIDASVPGIPHFVYTDHTHLENLKYPGFSRHELFASDWIKCEKQTYNNAELNFTMSTNISRSIHEDYGCPKNKIICVYGGANVQAQPQESLPSSRFARKNILFVGVDWERKGGPVLAKAFQQVLKVHPEATLTVVGCRPSLTLPNCEVIGQVPLAEVKKYFQQASVFCLPSNNEPFGIVFLEAMAHRLPIVGTQIGAIPDFIEQGVNGYLVQPGEVQALAECLLTLLDSSVTCEQFGDASHALYWRQYTWGHAGRRIQGHINEVLQAR